MSVVSGITLHTSSADDERSLIDAVQRWLLERHFGPLVSLVSVEDKYGGSKHPQVSIWGAGYNYFSTFESEFAKFVVALPWEPNYIRDKARMRDYVL